MPFGKLGFRKFGPRLDIPKPVKVGEEYDVEINEVGSKGDGIARIKNFVVFIAGAKQGEKTRIKITQVKNRFAIGEKVLKNLGEEE
ncbi:MAG: TRAM domain-containing protein [Candidatus Aenigmatarchaeota archaeon]